MEVNILDLDTLPYVIKVVQEKEYGTFIGYEFQSYATISLEYDGVLVSGLYDVNQIVIIEQYSYCTIELIYKDNTSEDITFELGIDKLPKLNVIICEIVTNFK